MIEKNADEFVVASEITVNARGGVVRIKLAEQQQDLRGMKARELLASILTSEDFDRIDRIHKDYGDKWGPEPWSGT